MFKNIKSFLWIEKKENNENWNENEDLFMKETEEVREKIKLLLIEKWDAFKKAEHYIEDDTLNLSNEEYQNFLDFCKNNWINIDITWFNKNKHILTRSIKTKDKSLTIIIRELLINKI